MVTMAKTRQEEVEEAVIQAIGHRERRNILKIINASPNGATYSEILGETDLNTGHLNYHLRGLEGLVERNESRQYRLTPLGLKAILLLSTIGEEINNEDTPYINAAVAIQSSLLHPLLSGFLNFMLVVDSFGLVASLWLLGKGVYSGELQLAYAGIVLALICGGIVYSLLRARRTAPDYLRMIERRYLK